MPVFGAPHRAPDVSALIEQFRRCSPWSTNGWNRVKHNEDVRFSRWAGQSPDCKKQGSAHEPAFPWPGASDQRSYDADDIVLTNVAELWESFFRAWLSPKAGASEESNYAVKLADWIINEACADKLPRQIELSAQYREGLGLMVLQPTWELEIALEPKTVTLDQLASALEQLSQGLAQDPMAVLEAFPQAQELEMLPELILGGEDDAYAAELLQMVWEFHSVQQMRRSVELPALPSERLKRAVRELREKGTTELPIPYVCVDGPMIWALKPWKRVFFNDTVGDVQRAPGVFVRELVTEVELRSRILTRNWDPGWVEQAVKHKGKLTTWQQTQEALMSPSITLQGAMSGSGAILATQVDSQTDFIEVVYAYTRLLDDDNVPGVYLTVLHPEVGASSAAPVSKASSYAWHGLVKDARNKFQFIVGARENVDEHLGASRGIPEIANSPQRVVKANLDAGIDWASLIANPPLNIYTSTVGTNYQFGPGARNYYASPGREAKTMDLDARGIPVSENIINLMERRLSKYFGHEHPDLTPGHGNAKRQMRASSFLMAWASAVQMSVDQCQTNMRDEQFSEITGAPAGWLEERRSRFGMLAARLQFDVRELDPKYVAEMLKAFNQEIVPGDVAGVMNRSKLTKMAAHMVNPRWARELVQEDSAASQQMFDAVKSDVAFMFVGQEVQYPENDPAAKTKIGYLQQIIQSNPTYLQTMQQQPEGRFAQLLQKYAESLQFSQTQQDNKQIGRIGVRPAGMEAS